MAAVKTCPKCGKPRNALTVHRTSAKGDHQCVECLREGEPLSRSVVLWMGRPAEEVMPAGR